MFFQRKAAFSSNGDYFALTSVQGLLQIWDTESNTIKQECDLKSQTNLTCFSSCLVWGPTKENISSNQQGFPIKDKFLQNHRYLAIGTESGEILLYDAGKRTISVHFESCHVDAINDLSWHADSDSLFSCSSDRSISIWDCSTGMLKMKFQDADEDKLNSLCVIDSDNLLVASTSISWWCISQQAVIKKFIGHTSPIFQLLPVYSTDMTSCSYFISASVYDSKICAWSLNSSRTLRQKESSSATFDTNDELEAIDVTKSFSKQKPMFLSSLTKKGSLILFKHVLNGKVEKDIHPQMTLRIESKPVDVTQQSQSIPIIACKFSDCSDYCIIAYGNLQCPVFEKIKITDCPKTLTLSRDIPVYSEVKMADKMDYILANGEVPVSLQKLKSPKRKKSSISKEEKSETSVNISPCAKKKIQVIELEENLPLEKKEDNNFLKDRRLVQKHFSQSLINEDRALLNVVLHCDNCQTIANCVQNLPLDRLHFLLHELHRNLNSETERHIPSLRLWLKEILNTHLLYIKQKPDFTNVIHQFREHIESLRVSDTLLKMSTLKGLLNVLRIRAHKSGACSDSNTDHQMET